MPKSQKIYLDEESKAKISHQSKGIKKQKDQGFKNFYKNVANVLCKSISIKCGYIKLPVDQYRQIMEAVMALKRILINYETFIDYMKFLNNIKNNQFEKLFWNVDDKTRELLISSSRDFFFEDIVGCVLFNQNIKEDKQKYLQKIPILLAKFETLE